MITVSQNSIIELTITKTSLVRHCELTITKTSLVRHCELTITKTSLVRHWLVIQCLTKEVLVIVN